MASSLEQSGKYFGTEEEWWGREGVEDCSVLDWTVWITTESVWKSSLGIGSGGGCGCELCSEFCAEQKLGWKIVRKIKIE